MSLFKAHLIARHDLTFYPYQLQVAEKLFDALIQNLRLTAGASEEDVKKLKIVEIPIEFSRQCFNGKTLVSTDQGFKPIAAIEVGDQVLSYGEKIEYKPVTWKTKYSLDTDPKPMLYWEYNGEEVKSTYDHPFYYRGQYIPIYQLAWGSMETSQRQKLKLLCKQYGQTFDNTTSWRIQDSRDEASAGRKRVSQDSGGRRDYKNTSVGSSNMDTKSEELADSQPHQSRQDGQSDRQSGMVDGQGQYPTQPQSREGSQQTGGELRNAQTDQRASIANTQFGDHEVYKGISAGIQGQLQYNLAHPTPIELEEHLIKVSSVNESEDTYAITVADNHNYFVTKQQLLVKNSGKTTAIVHAIEFIMLFFPELFKRPVRIGIFAPQREQAKTDFDRLKFALAKSTQLQVKIGDEPNEEESNAKTIVLPNGASCYIFPVTSTSKPESKSLDLIVFEESQDLDDRIIKEQIWPMGASTNAARVYIGTAGTRICYFYRLGQSGDALKLYYDQITTQRREVYTATGNALHLIYEQSVKGEIEKHGRDSDEIARPYFGKWLIGTGQFTTQEDLEALVTERKRSFQDKQSDCFAGIDTAKHPDSTVVTILRWNDKEQKKQVLNWMELRGENYKDQFDIIMDFLKYYNVQAMAIDSTGQGDFMPDMFERESNWTDENTGLYRVKFSAVSKDIIYKNLKVSISELLTDLPELGTREGERFKQQMLDLQQEWKGQLLSVHHPDDVNAHDDYGDSWALAEYAFARWQETRPQLHVVAALPERRVKNETESANNWPGLDDAW